MQVDKKALYIERHGLYEVLRSYATPIIFIHNNKVYTTDTKYSTTTSKHKTHALKKIYNNMQVITITQKVFNNTLSSQGVFLGRA